MKHQRLQLLTLTCLAALLAVAPAVHADETAGDDAPPSRMIVHFDQVVPDMAEAYEASAKAWVEAFQEADMGSEWDWYTSSANDFTYVTAFPFSTWSELDRDQERQMAVKEALGEEKLSALNKPSGAVHAHHSEVIKLRQDLSYSPADSSVAPDAKFMRIGVHTVKPGMEKQFEELMKGVVEAFAKAEYPAGFNMWEIEFGAGTYVTTMIADNAQTFYGFPTTGETLNKAVGDERTEAMYADWRSCLTAYETYDTTRRRDLSYIAEKSD